MHEVQFSHLFARFPRETLRCRELVAEILVSGDASMLLRADETSLSFLGVEGRVLLGEPVMARMTEFIV